MKCKDSNSRLQECEKSRKMTPPKSYNNLPVVDPKDMEICNLSNKEFKITGLRKFNKL